MQITQIIKRRDGVTLKVVSDIFRAISNLLKKFLIGGIKFYRKYLSPLKRHTHCRFIPTCSQYALEAIEKYGPFKGTFLALKRILRCNPFSKGGCDPVP
jgi:putative membrane protein insertion efficiency factor